MAKVLAISSHVVRGTVGLDATVPGLQWLGHEVWALPTVQLATRPGLGRIEKREVTGAELAATLAALEADGCWPMLDAVLTGYFAGPGAVAAAADAIGHIKARQSTRGRAGGPGARRRRPALRGAGDGRGDPRPAHPPRQPRHAQPVRARLAHRRGCGRQRCDSSGSAETGARQRSSSRRRRRPRPTSPRCW